MTQTINKAELILARLLMKRAIEERGEDYVYTPQAGGACKYLTYEKAENDRWGYRIFENPNGPACLIGFMLVEAGVDFATLQHCEGESAYRTAELVFPSDEVRTALNAAQHVQDSGGTWGEAREAFETRLAEIEAGLAGIV